MKKVLCWCCEYFMLTDEKPPGVLENQLIGICHFKNIRRLSYDEVCEDFLMNSGLHTKRTIPSYCKNYKEN